jgi:hypothetical protein
MVRNGTIESLPKLAEFSNHGPGAPVRIARIANVDWSMRVEEDRGPRAPKKLIDLAADVTEIDVGCFRIGHVRRRGTAQVDVNMGRAAVFGMDAPRPCSTQTVDAKRPGAFEHHHMWRKDEIVAIALLEEIQHLAAPPIP